jgi:hypothetical protein
VAELGPLIKSAANQLSKEATTEGGRRRTRKHKKGKHSRKHHKSRKNRKGKRRQ